MAKAKKTVKKKLRTFTVQLSRTDVTQASFEIEASSVEEAERIAEEKLANGDEPDEDTCDASLGCWQVESVDD